MNIRISLLFVFLVGLFCFSCTSKKYKLELTEHNYDRLLYLNKKERMYSFRLRDKATATINGKNYVKKGEKYNGDILLVHSVGKDEKVFSHLHSLGHVNLFNIHKSSKGSIFINGEFSKELIIDGEHSTTQSSKLVSSGLPVFVAKYNKNKELEWLKIIQGTFVNAHLNEMLIDGNDNIYFSVRRDYRREPKSVYEGERLGTDNMKSSILMQINAKGELTWTKEYPLLEYEAKVAAKAIGFQNNLLIVNRDFTKKIRTDGSWDSTHKLNLINLSKVGDIQDSITINRRVVIREIFPTEDTGIFLLGRSSTSTKTEPTDSEKVGMKKLGLTYHTTLNHLIKVDKKGEILWEKNLSNEFRNYRTKSDRIGYRYPIEIRNGSFTFISEHTKRRTITEAPTLFEVIKLDLENGDKTSQLCLIENVGVPECFLKDGKLIISGSSAYSFLKINGEKVKIKNSKFTRSQKKSEERLKLMSPFLLEIKI